MPSSTTTLTAADGFKSFAYVAEPSGTPKGAIVVLQEIFGVNSHIRERLEAIGGSEGDAGRSHEVTLLVGWVAARLVAA